jgi:hypothetical protein
VPCLQRQQQRQSQRQQAAVCLRLHDGAQLAGGSCQLLVYAVGSCCAGGEAPALTPAVLSESGFVQCCCCVLGAGTMQPLNCKLLKVVGFIAAARTCVLGRGLCVCSRTGRLKELNPISELTFTSVDCVYVCDSLRRLRT